MGELEKSVSYLKGQLVEHRKILFWFGLALLLFFLMGEAKELTTLLLLSYSIAILLDPIVDWIEERSVPRGVAIIGLYVVIFIFFLTLVAIALPAIIREYAQLIQVLPGYLKTVTNKFAGWAMDFGLPVPSDLEAVTDDLKDYVGALGVEQLRSVATAMSETVLRGYSVTMTLVNLALLPFFVYYIVRDLDLIHRFLGSYLSLDVRKKVSSIGGEILGHVYAFFKGQLTVSILMAVLYVIGLMLVGLPSALVVGVVAGLLNIVPYLGIALGILLATIITLVTDPSFTQLLMVWGVFVAVQGIEGTLLTPKIVGESVGIHPLGVMVALIVGAELFGLIGMVIAIPAAASFRVLFHHALSHLDEIEDDSKLIQSG